MLVFKKVLATTALFVLSILSLVAQQETTLPFLTWVPQAGYTDLTLKPNQYKKSIALPLIGSFQLYYFNSAFKFNGLVHGNTIEPNSVIPKLKKYNHLYSGGSFDIFSMRFENKQIYYQLSLRDVWTQRFVYTKDLADILWNGNAGYAGQTANLKHVRFAANYYRELALAATKSVNDRLTVGVRGKILMGITNVTTQESNSTLYTDPNGFSLNGHSEFTLLTSGLVNDEQIKVSDFFSLKNLGLAADLGARYKVSDKLSVACNVNNIGFIRWKKDVKNYRINGDYNYTGYIMHDSTDIANADWQNIVDTLEVIFKPKEDSKSYNSWLTPTIYLSGNYLLKEHLSLYSSLAIDLYHSFRPALTMGATQTFGEKIQATLNYTIMPNSYLNFGGGIAMRGGPVQMYMACDNVVALFDPYNVKYFNTRVGINFIIGHAHNDAE